MQAEGGSWPTDGERVRVFYLAVNPGPLRARSVRASPAHGLKTRRDSRVVIEKPVGKNFETAQVVNEAVGAVFDEQQIYRIDHYLGKETVQNLMALRFANALFEPLWNAAQHRPCADHRGRGPSVSRGAAPTTTRPARCATWCRTICCSSSALSPWSRPPGDGGRCGARREAESAEGLVPIDGRQCMRALTVRGQYAAGASAGGAVPCLREEVEAIGQLDAPRPSFRQSRRRSPTGVGPACPSTCVPASAWPSGSRRSWWPSRHSRTRSSARVHRHAWWPNQPGHPPAARRGREAVADDQGSGARRHAPAPRAAGHELCRGLRRAASPDAYERLMMDVIRGNPTLFMRRDEVDAAWNWVDPILVAWRRPAARRPSPTRRAPGGLRASVALIESATAVPGIEDVACEHCARRVPGRADRDLADAEDFAAPEALAAALAESRCGRICGRRTGGARYGRAGTSPAARTPRQLLWRHWRMSQLDWAARSPSCLVDDRWVPATGQPALQRGATCVAVLLQKGPAAGATASSASSPTTQRSGGGAVPGHRGAAGRPCHGPSTLWSWASVTDGHTASFFPGGDHLAEDAIDPRGRSPGPADAGRQGPGSRVSRWLCRWSPPRGRSICT